MASDWVCHLSHKVLACIYTLCSYCVSRLEEMLWDVSFMRLQPVVP